MEKYHSLANDFTTRLNCNIQGKTFLQRFVVSPAPLPGVSGCDIRFEVLSRTPTYFKLGRTK